MSEYMERLKAHPGKGIATILMVLGGAAGFSDGGLPYLFIGALGFGIPCWTVVLWTARTQPLPEERHD